jgi:hypothetical protein
MSFFDFMSRMVEGKPVFEEENKNPVAQQAETVDQAQPRIDKANDRTFPVAYIKRLKTSLNGRTMDVYGQIVNSWTDEIMLDKIRINGSTREIDNFLKAGEEREFLIYSGPKLTKECFEAQLDYKTKEEVRSTHLIKPMPSMKCGYGHQFVIFTGRLQISLNGRDYGIKA